MRPTLELLPDLAAFADLDGDEPLFVELQAGVRSRPGCAVEGQ